MVADMGFVNTMARDFPKCGPGQAQCAEVKHRVMIWTYYYHVASHVWTNVRVAEWSQMVTLSVAPS